MVNVTIAPESKEDPLGTLRNRGRKGLERIARLWV